MNKSSFRNPSRASSVRRPQFDFTQIPDLFNFSVGSDDKLRVKLKPNADFQSDDFEEGVAGWRLAGNGDVEVENGFFRGEIQATDGTFTGIINATDGLFQGSIQAGPLTMSNVLTGLSSYTAAGKRADTIYTELSAIIGANKYAFFDTPVSVTREAGFGAPSTFSIDRIVVDDNAFVGKTLSAFDTGGNFRFLARYDTSGSSTVDLRLTSQASTFTAQGFLYRLEGLPTSPGAVVGDIYQDASGFLRITQ